MNICVMDQHKPGYELKLLNTRPNSLYDIIFVVLLALRLSVLLLITLITNLLAHLIKQMFM